VTVLASEDVGLKRVGIGIIVAIISKMSTNPQEIIANYHLQD
jgi:hypothetical protein